MFQHPDWATFGRVQRPFGKATSLSPKAQRSPLLAKGSRPSTDFFMQEHRGGVPLSAREARDVENRDRAVSCAIHVRVASLKGR